MVWRCREFWRQKDIQLQLFPCPLGFGGIWDIQCKTDRDSSQYNFEASRLNMDDVILKFITSKPSIRYRIAMWCYTTLVVTRCLCRISCHTDDLSLRGTCCRACVKTKNILDP